MNGDNWKNRIYADSDVIDLTWVLYLVVVVWVVIAAAIFFNYITIDQFIPVKK